MSKRERLERTADLTIRIGFSLDERQQFDRAMEEGLFVRGKWVREAIMEKLARERQAKLEVVR